MTKTSFEGVVAAGVLRGATFACTAPITLLIDDAGDRTYDGPLSAGTLALRLFAGIARPSSGRVLAFGVDPASDPAARRDIALLGDPALLPTHDAADDARRIAELRGVPVASVEPLLAGAATADGIRALADALANDARAKLVLVAYPERYGAGRDAVLGRARAAADRGATVIIATHALDEVLSVAADDRAIGVVLARGVVAATAPAHALPWAIPTDGTRTRVVRVVVGDEQSAKLAAELLADSAIATSLALIEPISTAEVRFHTRDPRAVARAIGARAKDGADIRALTVLGAPIGELLGGPR